MEPQTEPTSEPVAPAVPRQNPAVAPGPRIGLSGKLLFLTILFVMVAEVLIYVPSIANFRLNWLNDRLAAAHTAALVLDAAPSGMVPESLAKQILKSIGARAVAMKMGTQRRLLAASDVPSKIEQDIDMRNVPWWHAVMDAFDTLLFCQPDDVMRLVGPAPMAEGQFIEIILDEAPLRKAMLSFSVEHPAAVVGDLRRHRHAGVLRAALSSGAADGADHRQHDHVPRRPGKSGAHHRRIRPQR